MLKILNSEQMHRADAATLKVSGISSHSLMEQASLAFVNFFCELISNKDEPVLILCGTGNNGGDGLAIARILQYSGYSHVSVLIYRSGRQESSDFSTNLQLLEKTQIPITNWKGGELPIISENIIIDALLGIGLNRPLEGDLLKLTDFINQLEKHVIAVDIPTGMRSEGRIESTDSIVKAKEVITFQLPKLNFFFPESVKGLDQFFIANIGLDEESIADLPSDYSLVEASDISRIYKRRTSFSHKGTYGKALIIAGNTGTIGAALLCAEACLNAGAGLTTACISEESELALNIRHPEIMFVKEQDVESWWNEFTAVAIGPGLGERSKIINRLFSLGSKSTLLDADALNFLSQNPKLKSSIPENTIITPHMKEFDRLFGDSYSWWERLQKAREKAQQYKIIIVLKNRYTFIVLSDGQVRINPTGNPAMASGGMGDALSGIITAFLAQGYSPEEAAVLGCYVHGGAGDLLEAEGMAVIPASQLIKRIPFVLGAISNY